MTGTDDSTDDDALYVLTAALLTPAQFPTVLGDDYPEACAALGIASWPRGYGLVMGQDSGGARWTVVVDDVSLVAVAIAAWDCGMEYDLSPDERTIVSALPGWPVALAVTAPGLPAPHDPEPDPGGPPSAHTDGGPPPLAPPDTETWGPAQRRLGADEIALQWTAWRERLDGAVPVRPAETSENPESEQSAGTTGTAAGVSEPSYQGVRHQDVRHQGVRRVLKELRAYVDTPPPLGRVRSSFAPGGARTLRADGPGWSFVARTDDIAFVLMDDEPGEVLPVGRGTELPALLAALDAMAVRPA
ncbi:hypothetical protein [Streptomyces sp. AK02-01A]|uniref:hypothetical protein n=1 Tax=Streptomyces sp. AK02-01A TaxID=3028648 RepID=UPI0029AB0A4B|nr:hypothetical protein [Streptomyces sp. AK02-01A]MDX3849975.1 hypothetical protein [Streptomyces sp. AK02-01A]